MSQQRRTAVFLAGAGIALIGIAAMVAWLRPARMAAAPGAEKPTAQAAGAGARGLTPAQRQAKIDAEENALARRERPAGIPLAGKFQRDKLSEQPAPPVPDERTAQDEAYLARFGVLCNSQRSLQALRRDPSVIVLRNAIIDTGEATPGALSVPIPQGFAAAEDTTRFIVQFDDPISEAQRQALAAAGAHVEHYVPNRAFAVTAGPEALAQIQAMADVTFIEPFHPFYKMSEDVQAYLLGTADQEQVARVQGGMYTAMLFAGDGEGEPAAALEALGAEVILEETGAGAQLAKIRCTPELLDELVSSEATKWVEAWSPPQFMNDIAHQTLRANVVSMAYPGLDGSGVTVCVNDSGVDHTHRAFAIDPDQPTSYPGNNTRIVYYSLPSGWSLSDGVIGDTEGHGSHVAGSVLGNGGLSSTVLKAPGSGNAPYAADQFSGMAPKSQLVLYEGLAPFSTEGQYRSAISLMAQTAYRRGARLQNNSWGWNTSSYGTQSMIWDEIVRDADPGAPGYQQYIVFFSAGNSGSGTPYGHGGTPYTVGMPANAKNVITVGAVEHRRLCNNLPPYNSILETDSDWQVAPFSSRGPTPDGRIKPDIMAPGSFVMSVQSKDVDFDSVQWPTGVNRDFHNGNLDSGPNYAVLSGTSMASPLACGAGTLLFQYYTNTLGQTPSASMMKALLVSGAQTLHSILYDFDPYGPSVVDEGWGMVDLSRSIDGPRVSSSDEMLLFDETQSIGATGDSYIRVFDYESGGDGDLKIVVAWSDAPATPGVGNVLVNDLDLIVWAPDGSVYQGNYMDRRVWGTMSLPVTGDDYNPAVGDGYNNVEVATIRNPQVGTYQIEVRGYQVPQPVQPYSLVIVRGHSTFGDSGGVESSLALDGSGFPILVNTCSETGVAGDEGIIGVRHWVGTFGEGAEYHKWRQLRGKWFDFGSEWWSEIVNGSVLDSQVREPSVAMNTANGNVYAAWRYQSFDDEAPTVIYLRYFDGQDWDALGGSYQNHGICDPDLGRDASSPIVGIGADGQPIVAYVQKWLQTTPTPAMYKDAVVKKWNGTAWVPFDGSLRGFVRQGSYISGMDMVVDDNGWPVLVWRDLVDSRVRSYRWNGTGWAQIGSDLGNLPAGRPRITMEDGLIGIAWVEYPDGGGQTRKTVRVAWSTGGGWGPLAGSMSYPGVSGDNDSPDFPQIGLGGGNLFVAWQSGDTNGNRVLLKQWDGANWIGVDGSDTVGIENSSGISIPYDLVVNAMGLPIVSMQTSRQNQFGNPVVETTVFGLVGDVEPPEFEGLISAEGTSFGTVDLVWEQVFDPAQQIRYNVYRTPGPGWDPADPNIPGPNDPSAISAVFSSAPIATVIDTGGYTVGGLPPDRVWYFGVRSINESGLMDSNNRIILTGPYSPFGDADQDWLPTSAEESTGTDPLNNDTDNDGMYDGWEWYYSTYNPGHANPVALDPLDSGYDNLLTPGVGDGTEGQNPYDDLDGDGMLNIEEHDFWLANNWVPDVSTVDTNNPVNWWLDPTNPDTDGDTMPDGWEQINGLNPADPSDGGLTDSDGDGISNVDEYALGTNPNSDDTDGDGLTDPQELQLGTDPTKADTDEDGLQDGFEAGVGADPLDADTDGDWITDGDEYQMGYNDIANSGVNVNLILSEDFEDGPGTWVNWSTYSPSIDMWHRTAADPDPPNMVPRLFPTHSTNHAFRCAIPDPPGTTNGSYDANGELVYCALDTPQFNPVARGAVNLTISWMEHYETEAEWDLCEVLVSRDGGAPWYIARVGVSGFSGGWVHRVADISDYISPTMKVRFLFRTLNTINNQYRGWYVDDVRVYAGTRIAGEVRDENGVPLNGATVMAIGRGGLWSREQGHQYQFPGKIFGQAECAEDGSYMIEGLPQGSFYVKATIPGFRSEFWNGQLYSQPEYWQAFGQVINPGVNERWQAQGSGFLNLRPANSIGNCDFELARGAARGSLGVLTRAGSFPVYLNQTVEQALLWNGEATNPRWVPYLTAPSVDLSVHPDWETNNWETSGVRPTVISGLGQGAHEVFLHPGVPDMPFVPRVTVPVRDGEYTLVNVGVGRNIGYIYVTYDGAASPIVVDGRVNSGYTTTGTTQPTVIPVYAGDHEVTILPAEDNVLVPPLALNVPAADRVFAPFNTNTVLNNLRSVTVVTRDINSNPIVGAEVYVNGLPITANDVLGTNTLTPCTLNRLVPGTHWVATRKDGYRSSPRRTMAALPGSSNTVVLVMQPADLDYDMVGDSVEIDGYGDVFLWSRSDDPDQDGLSNLVEYDQIVQNGTMMNIGYGDSDYDLMGDGTELAYDGKADWLSLSVLEDRVAIGDTQVRVYFRGRYLAGQNAFNTALLGTAGSFPLSIDGDLFTVTSMSWDKDELGTPVMVFALAPNGLPRDIISWGHDVEAPVFGDTIPDAVDTDGDGMWDQFEFVFEHVNLHPLDYGPREEDPDNDGLINVNEFLGADGLANTNDWTYPDTPDSDGDIMPDGWEIEQGLDPLDPSDAQDDPDQDGLVNVDEWQQMTNPQNPDTDGDGLNDGPEVHTYGCDPLLIDTDYDQLTDGQEVWDTDLDPLTTIDGGFFPDWDGGDLDEDGFVDGPTDWDTDGDGMPDGFEVLDVWGNIRPEGMRLDPYDPTDADEDYDGDGLTNLEEYLIRDALVGNHPSEFNPLYAGVIWDYSTDPFNADSDGDGMPDGFEAWYGLHPMDPIPIPAVGQTGDFIRWLTLWLYGDLDADGMVNWNEYNIRFQLDSGATSNELSGSTHPWLFDTDEDGLGDGEEVKSFASHPLQQDTDADGLMDGAGIDGRFGEVDTLGHTNHYDKALNDMWVLHDDPDPLPPYWIQLFSNQPSPTASYPAPRWGSAGTYVSYQVGDDRGAVVSAQRGAYAGIPVAGVSPSQQAQIANQTLLAAQNFLLFGGRDGVTHYPEVWECRNNTNGWEWVFVGNIPTFRIPPPGTAELCAATRLYSLDEYPLRQPQPNPRTMRPRPGGPPAYRFYDGDPYTAPWAVNWQPGDGTNVVNWDNTIIFGGWYGFTHSYSPWDDIYKSADHNRQINHWWGRFDSATDKVEPGPLGLVTELSDIWIGTTVEGLTTLEYFTGVNCDFVMNVIGEFGGSATNPAVRATLEFEARSTSASSFQVEVWAEMMLRQASSLPNPSTHWTYSSWPYYRERYPLYLPYITPHERYNGDLPPELGNMQAPEIFSVTTNTVPAHNYGDTVSIDVTDQFVAMLNHGNWELGNSMGFIIKGIAGAGNAGQLKLTGGDLYIENLEPSFNVDSQYIWLSMTMDGEGEGPVIERKSAAMAYSDVLTNFVVFGGVNGLHVLDTTLVQPALDWHTWDYVDPEPPLPWPWITLSFDDGPCARYGHSMTPYDEGVLMFGGFDENHEPLNDLWSFNGTNWTEVQVVYPEVPQPRGGCAFGHAGAWIAMYGGTDNKTYFNDTWVLQEEGLYTNVYGQVYSNAWKWIMIQPHGEHGVSPPGRAHMAYNNNQAGADMFIFGGRTGTLPTGTDTDFDFVDDGIERELGGPSEGRDARINALFPYTSALTIDPGVVDESVPYVYKRLGPIPASWPFGFRSGIIDFEAMEAGTGFEFDLHAAFFMLPQQGYSPNTFGVSAIGVDAYAPELTNLWYHRFGLGNALDERDVWEVGVPHNENLSPNAAPRYAHSGRWCYGTDLDGFYRDDSLIELYTPLFSLPPLSMDTTGYDPGDPSTWNTNGYFLVFYEWLDLADGNDVVRIEAVRPTTQADIVTRRSGLDRPIVPILPNRNNAHNTQGDWRRVVVPLEPVANETNLFFRFVLQSDPIGHAGGWYIDDVQIAQGGQIMGTYTNGGNIFLYGQNGTNALASVPVGVSGDFGFEFLAAGNYVLQTEDGSVGQGSVVSGGGTWNVIVNSLTVNPITLSITVNTPAIVSWNAIAGRTYEVQYTTPELIGTPGCWTPLTQVTATGPTADFIDFDSENVESRLYRVVLLPE